jgi:hypothetical protein
MKKEQPVEDSGGRLLLSTRSVSRMIGCDPKTWQSIAQANGIEPISSGSGRTFWRRLEVERLISVRENA